MQFHWIANKFKWKGIKSICKYGNKSILNWKVLFHWEGFHPNKQRKKDFTGIAIAKERL